MLTNEIINHMDVYELRNYVAIQREILDVYGELTLANDNVIHQWEDLYHALEQKEDVLKSLNARKGKMARFVNEMMNKYKEYLDRPVEGIESIENKKEPEIPWEEMY